eukprot:c6464_g1_i1 orf=888-1829(+)
MVSFVGLRAIHVAHWTAKASCSRAAGKGMKGSENLREEGWECCSEDSSSFTEESPNSPEARRTVVWSNAVFHPESVDRACSEDSDSGWRPQVLCLQRKIDALVDTVMEDKTQKSPIGCEENQKVDIGSEDVDTSSATSSQLKASEEQESAVYPDMSRIDCKISEGSVPMNPAAHPAAKKVLFAVSESSDGNDASIFKASEGKSDVSSTAASKPISGSRAESCSSACSPQEHAAPAKIMPDAADDRNSNGFALVGSVNRIDEIEEEIQRLTKRLIELRLQAQAAKQHSQRKSNAICYDNQRKATNVCGQTLISD